VAPQVFVISHTVIPAKAGIQAGCASEMQSGLFVGDDTLHPGLRRNDGCGEA
jgi:hypothetical protein